MNLFATTSLATALLFAAPALAQDNPPTPTTAPATAPATDPATAPTTAPADAPTPTAAPTEGAATPTADGMAPVTVEMLNAEGESAGTVTVTPTPHGLLLAADLSGLGDGERSFHLHETGTCEGDFSSAGGHYNPTDKEHGFMAENGPHAGDMPNFTAAGGDAAFQTFNPMVAMSGGEAPLNDADGTAIVVHDGADDYASQPAGDAGDRIACGVVFAAE